VVVTGGAGGIGAAIAEELGRSGAFVVTLDPVVSVDGTERLDPVAESTAERIVAAGGTARASNASVTDRNAVQALFEGLVAEHGRLDAVVNVAGISRPTGFARGDEQDWADVVGVHLDGYLNVLEAALPIMAAAGRGTILGVTSGSGWRAADTGAYGCAKRAVASLTWELGRVAPEGVVLNALSPIAATRMVAAALAAARGSGHAGTKGGVAGASRTGGLSLGTMPAAEDLGPVGAHLVGEGFSACRGQVLFACGSEAAVVAPPRLLEAVRTSGVRSLPHVLAAVSDALAAAEAAQATSGGGNARFGPVFGPVAGEGEDDGEPATAPAVRSCAVVADRPDMATAVADALGRRGVAVAQLGVPVGCGFDTARRALADAAAGGEPVGALVVVAGGRRSGGEVGAIAGAGAGNGQAEGWEQVLAGHAGLSGRVLADAAWARAVADLAASGERPVRMVTAVDATTAAGRSRAQAAAQLSRSAAGATGARVAAFAVAVESDAAGDRTALGELTAHLLCSAGTESLSGAELVVGQGWAGLRSHPWVAGSITYGGPEVPPWFDGALGGILGR
jgi:NAD(P)-dependent dehydrogenase (short-subunit alcohol dehydrogenase family)